MTLLQQQKREVKNLSTKLNRQTTLLQNRVDAYDREPRQLALIQQTTKNCQNLSEELLVAIEKIEFRKG